MHDNSLDRIGEITGIDAGVHFQWHEFNAAHAFLRDEGHCYDPAAARICYDMVLELFTRTLNKE